MRIGVSGKGGVGKTTVAAGLARCLGRQGRPVLAIDCDSDPNLAMGVGLSEPEAGAIRPLLEQSHDQRCLPPDGMPIVDLIEAYGQRGPDAVTVLLAAQAERAGSGWTGSSHVTVRDVIGRAEAEAPDLAVVADMEAGLEHLSWAGGTLAYVDMLCIVAEPTTKSLVTAARTRKLATELGIGHAGLVANRVTEDSRALLDAFAAEQELEVLARLPEDDQVRHADQAGLSPLDHAPDSPINAGLTELAGLLAARHAPEPPTMASDG